MKRVFLLLNIFSFLFVSFSFSQTCPPNIDFEKGDFSGWECLVGGTSSNNGKNFISLQTSPSPVAGRHEILTLDSASAKDPYGNFPKLCPYGGTYSVKLGNDQTGSEAEGLRYTFTVPSTVDTFTFTYFYAVVFQDPNHAFYEQPRFFVTAYDVATNQIINCASYNYVSNGTLPGFKKSKVDPQILYREWSPVSLQFAGLQNRKVALEFRTADCTLGGHFGYAYIDVGSACSNILATAPYCRETNSLILNAPYGFQTYTWYNEDYTKVVGSDQSITLSPPPATSGYFYVDVIPYPGYGCRDTFQAKVMPLPVPDTPAAKPFYEFCQFSTANILEATAQKGNDLLWYVNDSTSTPQFDAPLPVTSKVDTLTYFVSQKKLFGCESFKKKVIVKIEPTPKVTFAVDKPRQCEEVNRFTFQSVSSNLSDAHFVWDFGNGDTASYTSDTTIVFSYPTYGSFSPFIKVTNGAICSASAGVQATVVPKPIADFTYPSVVCENQTQLYISNTSTVPAGLSNINQWWWSIDNKTEQTQVPSPFIPLTADPLNIRLTVATDEGCKSDTTNKVLLVWHQPKPAFSFGSLLCDNEVIHFNDASVLPGNPPGESVTKWYWQFDNVGTSSQQNPDINLPAGMQHITFASESNFGCRSINLDTQFIIYPKPHISLSINDSCVYRLIKYQANDLSNSVDKWLWDFGDGFYNDGPLIKKNFNREGYRPLILIGQTIYQCKDTIVRPFTIYDNKAFAGRDTVAAWGEPVQLNAHGGANVQYTWSPSFGLDNPSIENPVALNEKDQLYRLDAVTDKGCDSHTKILIRRYKGPELYIPTAFTPNADGLNDVLKVFPVGIKTFKVFNVYNRFGQLVFHTTDYTKGWDGRYNGSAAPPDTYVAYALATDYKNEPMSNKVSVVLIR